MEVRIVDVEHCGGAVVTVTGEMLTSRIVEVKILPCPGSPPAENGQRDTTALAAEDQSPSGG